MCKDEIFTTYTEVTRIGENPYVTDLILKQLREFAQCLPYRIDVQLKERLSIPKMEMTERKVQKDLVENSLDLFKKSLTDAILTLTYPEKQIEIDTDDIIFTLTKTELKIGYVGIIESECIHIPTSKLNEYIKGRLIKKAKKRDSFEGEHRNYPYIIAINWCESFLDETDVNNLLYGSVSSPISNEIGMPDIEYRKWIDDEWNRVTKETKNRASWTKIEKARDKGWELFLIKKFLIPNGNSHINNEGIFVTLEEMKNVSAVLFLNNWGKISYHPNPFCSDEINDPRIINFMNTPVSYP